MAYIKIQNDGYFDQYVCAKCGYKIQLVLCNDSFPEICWGCGEKFETTLEDLKVPIKERNNGEK